MTKKVTSKKKSAGLRLQTTDLALCLAAVFTTLSVVFMVMAFARYY